MVKLMAHESGIELLTKLPADVCLRVDQWATRHGIRSRELAIVELLELGLKQEQLSGQGARAEMLAGNEIDLMEDASATSEEKKIRKRRLTRGPSIFRDVRRDQTRDEG